MTRRAEIHPPGVWTIAVGWASVRPIIPDQHTAYVRVVAQDHVEAELIAAQIVASTGSLFSVCEMPTSTRIMSVEF